MSAGDGSIVHVCPASVLRHRPSSAAMTATVLLMRVIARIPLLADPGGVEPVDHVAPPSVLLSNSRTDPPVRHTVALRQPTATPSRYRLERVLCRGQRGLPRTLPNAVATERNE